MHYPEHPLAQGYWDQEVTVADILAPARERLLTFQQLQAETIGTPNELAVALLGVSRAVKTMAKSVSYAYPYPGFAPQQSRSPFTRFTNAVLDIAGAPTEPVTLKAYPDQARSVGGGSSIEAIAPKNRTFFSYDVVDAKITFPTDAFIINQLIERGEVATAPWIHAHETGVRRTEPETLYPFDVVNRRPDHVTRYVQIGQDLTSTLLMAVDARLSGRDEL